MLELGYNYRLTDIQAALGISQLKRADEGLVKRKAIANKYNDAFKDIPEIKGQSGYVEGHAYHLYIILTEKRKELYKFLKAKNIFCQVHYIPVHTLPYYKEQGSKKDDFPVAEKYYEECLSLPMFPALTNDEQNFVISSIKQFFDSGRIQTDEHLGLKKVGMSSL